MDFPGGPWKEKKAERICRGILAFLSMMGAALLGRFDKTRLPSEHLGRHKQHGQASGQPLRRDDVAGSRIHDKFGQEHLRSQQPQHCMLATGIILLDRTIRGLGQEARRCAVAAVCRTAQRCGQTRRRARS